MKIGKETEEIYTVVKKGLVDLDLTVPSGVSILANVMAVCEDIAGGVATQDIIDKFGINCNTSAFRSIFKRTVGISVKDVHTLPIFDRRVIELKKEGFAPSEIMKIKDIYAREYN